MTKHVLYRTHGREYSMNRVRRLLEKEGIFTKLFDENLGLLTTNHVCVKFITNTEQLDGLHDFDDAFGFELCDNVRAHLKNFGDGCYNGTLIGYIVKTEAEETLKEEQAQMKRAQRIVLNSAYGLTAGLCRPDSDYSEDAMVMKKAVAALGSFNYKPIIPNIKSYIKKVVFNDPATIIFWTDDTKTVVKAENEPFDPEKGMAMAIAKKVLGNKHDYYNTLVKWMKKYKPEESSNGPRTDAKRKALEEAYQILLKADDTRYDGKEGKATKIDYYMTVETALGYLGEALEG